MAADPVPTVFISHAHVNKSVARRVLRRLTAYGAKGWLDERELRVGTALTSSIRRHIERAGMVLVVASHASAQSDWVRQELGFAREHRKTIVPVFIDPLARHEMFKDDLGVDATYRPAFAGVLEAMTLDLFQSWGVAPPKPSEASLEAGLRDLVREEPDLAPLIQACLDAVGTHATQDDTVFGAAFHPLERR